MPWSAPGTTKSLLGALQAAVSQRLQCRVFVRGDLQLLTEYFISDNASHVERNMKIIVGHMLPDGMRGCEAAVSNNAAHVIRQFKAGSH